MKRTFFESFWFDVVTSLPFSWLELILWHLECKGENSELSPWAQTIKTPIRVLRPFRLMRLFRFIKVHPQKSGIMTRHLSVCISMHMVVIHKHTLNVAYDLTQSHRGEENAYKYTRHARSRAHSPQVMRVWSEYGMAVPLRVQKMIGLTASLFFVIHIFSCTYWSSSTHPLDFARHHFFLMLSYLTKKRCRFVKTSSESEDEVHAFLQQFGIDGITATPVQKWIVSGYFINTIFRQYSISGLFRNGPTNYLSFQCLC